MSDRPNAPDFAAQPRVPANDWRVLTPPPLGAWEPSRSVTLVIPCFRSESTLPYCLAALAAQTYPSHLLEVVVVDDGGPGEPITLPDLRPERTRVVRTTESWGRAHACATGAEAADGDVIHWLDADIVVFSQHVEAQMRWHHLVNYAAVLGQKTFVDPNDGGLPPVSRVFQAIRDGRAAELFDDRPQTPHQWVEDFYAMHDDLSQAGPSAFRVHVGATASVDRELYRRSGGMDARLKLGEDVELGYRLSAAGAVFIPERDARSWHLGRSTLMQRMEDVNRYNAPFLADRIPQIRWPRRIPGRTWSVPFVEVAVDANGHDFEAVSGAVDGVLASSIPDVRCVILGDWSALGDERHRPLDDDARELRMLQGAYAGDHRVELADKLPPTAFPAEFRMWLPAGWTVRRRALGNLLAQMEQQRFGLRSILLPDGRVARIERTGAVMRAALVQQPGEDPDDALDAVWRSWWSEAEESGLRPVLPEETVTAPRPPDDAAKPSSQAAPDPAALPGGPGRPPRARGELHGGTLRASVAAIPGARPMWRWLRGRRR